MLKNISNLGNILSRSELKTIKGSRSVSEPGGRCSFVFGCEIGEICRCLNSDCSIGECEYA